MLDSTIVLIHHIHLASAMENGFNHNERINFLLRSNLSGCHSAIQPFSRTTFCVQQHQWIFSVIRPK